MKVNNIDYMDAELDRKGWVDMVSGLYVLTKSLILMEQQTWHESDESYNTDFTGCHYWLVTDKGVAPVGFNKLQEIVDFIGEL